MECFICVNEFLSSKIFFSSPVRKNNFPFEKYQYTESRRCHDDVTSRRKKNSSSEDRNGRSKLTTNSLIWSVREYSVGTSSSDTNLARLDSFSSSLPFFFRIEGIATVPPGYMIISSTYRIDPRESWFRFEGVIHR